MATPYYRINSVDILPYLADGGFEWEENDIDSENSGRAMDGVMYRGLVARKDKHTLTFRKLTLDEIRTVTAALNTEYLTVETNIHPKRNGAASFTMYNSSRMSSVYTLESNNRIMWEMKSVSLIER